MVPLPVLETFDGTACWPGIIFLEDLDSAIQSLCATARQVEAVVAATQLPDGRAISDCSDLNLVGVQVAQCARVHVLPPRAYAVFLAS
eukprot:COSAG06_NODE_1996_length_7886_cov_6.036985_6_plen_88_part_00